MNCTDPIADMLTRIRNAGMAGHGSCDVPASKTKLAVAKILQEEGYIKDYAFVEDEGRQGNITINLKYRDKKPVIYGIKRVSTPGLRVYASCKKLPSVLDGMGIAIISTSKGLMTDKNARKSKLGGEVMAYVW